MNTQAAIAEYWTTVELCLVTFFEFRAVDAKKKVRDVRGRLDEGQADSPEIPLFYHQEPVNLAEDLTGKRVEWNEVNRTRYQSLLMISGGMSEMTLGTSFEKFLDPAPEIRNLVLKRMEQYAAIPRTALENRGEINIPGMNKAMLFKGKGQVAAARAIGISEPKASTARRNTSTGKKGRRAQAIAG